MAKMVDSGLANLLELNDSVLDQGDGYWIKTVAWQVAPSVDMPHGIRYSLTLHAPLGQRIMGYDNAHGVKPASKFKYAGQRLHKAGKGVEYESYYRRHHAARPGTSPNFGHCQR
jgi:Family of unknown function (DUF6516)